MKFGKVFVFLNRAIMKLIHLQKLKSKSKPVELIRGVFIMKRAFYIIVGTALMLLFSGCFNRDKVTDELIKYHNNEWQILQEMKEEKVKADTSEYILLAIEGNNKDRKST